MAKQKNIETEEPLEKKLWKTADKLRKNMDAAEYSIANPLSNDSDCSDELLQTDDRWQYGIVLCETIKTNTQQIRTLTGVRDTLLPKVMSGE